MSPLLVPALFSACERPGPPGDVALSPLPADETTVLQAVHDGEGEIRWYVGGVFVRQGPTLDGSRFDRGDEVLARLVPPRGEAVDSEPTTIVNALPRLGAVAIDPAVPTAATALSVVATGVEDPDGDPVDLDVVWLVDGVEAATGPTLAGVVGGQIVEALVTPTDGLDVGEARRSAAVEVANTPPVVLDARIEPDDPRSSDELSVVVDALDPDGDPVQLRVEWLADGALVFTGDLLPPGAAVRGQTVSVRVTPSDAEQDGAPFDGPSVVLRNGLPIVGAVAIDPAPLRTDDLASCEPSDIFEPDGDPVDLTFDWQVNGASVATSPHLSGALAFDAGDTVSCTLVVSDSAEAAPPAPSDVVVVEDTPPTAPTAALTPPDTHADELVRCAAATLSSDADGDPITYEVRWEVDGKPWTGAAETTIVPGDTVPAGVLDFGQRWTCTVVAVTPAASTDSPPAARDVPAARLENVLLVLLDDVGVDKIPSYGVWPQQPPLPTIDGLAASGVRFSRAWSTPVCSPTRGTILTGRYPRRTGLGATVDNQNSKYNMPQQEVLLPEALRRSPAPYATAMFGKWHLDYYRHLTWPEIVYAHGFGYFAGTRGNIGSSVLFLPLASGDTGPASYYPPSTTGDTGEDEILRGYHLYEKYEPPDLYWETNYATTETVDDVIEVVPTLAEPWYVQVSLHAVHEPLTLPPAHLFTQPVDEDSADCALYNATLEAADTELGRLLASLDPAVLGRTNVIVTGDNGTPDYAIQSPFDDSYGKSSINELGIHVPLIVSGPAVAQPGTVSDALVHTVDLFTTVAHIGGVRTSTLTWEDGAQIVPLTPVGTPDTGQATETAHTAHTADTGAASRYTGPVRIDGQSLLPYLADPGTSPRRDFVYTERFSPSGGGPFDNGDQRALRGERYKLVIDNDGSHQLYELDPATPNQGPDLLATGLPLTPSEQTVYDELLTEMNARIADLTFDH